MAILNIQTTQAGTTATLPSYATIQTNDTEATVLTAGYLNQAVQNGTSFQMPCIAAVSTIASAGAQPVVGWYNVQSTQSAGVPVTTTWSLTAAASPGGVVLPTIANHIATYTDTDGTLSEDPTTAISGGNIQAGLSGTAGYLASFPATAAKGSLEVKAVANTGNTVTTISNAAMGQTSVVSIPDPGAATANFLLNSGAQAMAAGSSIALDKGTGTESSHAVTIDKQSGVITTTSLTTAQYASETITLTNTEIATTSVVLASIMGGTNTVEGVTVSATAGSGTSTIVLTNTNSAALNGTVIIGFAVF